MIVLTCNPTKETEITCLCCGKKFHIPEHITADFCDSCFRILCREFFNKENGNLTVAEFREKIRTKIKEKEETK